MIPDVAIAAGAAFLTGLLAGALLFRWLRPRRPSVKRPRRRGSRRHLGRTMLDYECQQCGRQVVTQVRELRALQGIEVGLIMRERPQFHGRPLAEHLCPHCGAAHCFLMDHHPPVWAGMNFSMPHGQGRKCLECGKRVLIPPWRPGAWDGQVEQAPELDPDYGLICSRCNALICVDCSTRYTRNRRSTTALLCPRCMRGPVDKFFHAPARGTT